MRWLVHFILLVPTYAGTCIVDSSEAISDAMDAFMFTWAAMKRCGPTTDMQAHPVNGTVHTSSVVPMDETVKCEIDIASAVKAVNSMVNVVLQAIETCHGFHIVEGDCVVVAGSLTEYMAGLAAAGGRAYRECAPRAMTEAISQEESSASGHAEHGSHAAEASHSEEASHAAKSLHSTEASHAAEASHSEEASHAAKSFHSTDASHAAGYDQSDSSEEISDHLEAFDAAKGKLETEVSDAAKASHDVSTSAASEASIAPNESDEADAIEDVAEGQPSYAGPNLPWTKAVPDSRLRRLGLGHIADTFSNHSRRLMGTGPLAENEKNKFSGMKSPVMCTVDMKNTASSIYKATRALMRMKKNCKKKKDGGMKCASNILDIVGSFSAMGEFLASAVGECKESAEAKKSVRILCAGAVNAVLHNTMKISQAGVDMGRKCKVKGGRGGKGGKKDHTVLVPQLPPLVPTAPPHVPAPVPLPRAAPGAPLAPLAAPAPPHVNAVSVDTLYDKDVGNGFVNYSNLVLGLGTLLPISVVLSFFAGRIFARREEDANADLEGAVFDSSRLFHPSLVVNDDAGMTREVTLKEEFARMRPS